MSFSITYHRSTVRNTDDQRSDKRVSYYMRAHHGRTHDRWADH